MLHAESYLLPKEYIYLHYSYRLLRRITQEKSKVIYETNQATMKTEPLSRDSPT